MVTKSVIVTGLLASALGLPVALPYAAGAAVSVSLGPVAVEVSRAHGIAFDLDVSCAVASCPVAMLHINEIETPGYQPAA